MVFTTVPFLAKAEIDENLIAFVVAPLVTEAAKALGIILVLSLSRTFDSPTDGFVYGAAIGAGFAVTGQLAHGFASAAGPGVATLTGTLGAASWAIAVHVLTTGVLGACVGAGRLSGEFGRRFAWPFVGLAGAYFLQVATGWMVLKQSAGLVASKPWALIILLFFLVLAVVVIIFLAESRILRRQLADEVRLGVLPGWTVQVIPFYWRRARSDWWSLRRERTVISRLLTRLAFRKEALLSSQHGSANLEGLEIVRLRERIQKIICPPKNPISPLTEDMW